MKKSNNKIIKRSGTVLHVSRRFLPPDKFILDACCGGRWFWFDKKHPNAVYVDMRIAGKGHDKYRKNHSVEPDMVMDFRNLEFHDGVFQMVIFDPPHMATLGKTSKFRRYYGALNKETWQDDLRRGFSECFRVLKPMGTLIFKWNESEIKKADVLKLAGREPLVGHPTNSKNNTHWFCFLKLEAKNGG